VRFWLVLGYIPRTRARAHASGPSSQVSAKDWGGKVLLTASFPPTVRDRDPCAKPPSNEVGVGFWVHPNYQSPDPMQRGPLVHARQVKRLTCLQMAYLRIDKNMDGVEPRNDHVPVQRKVIQSPTLKTAVSKKVHWRCCTSEPWEEVLFMISENSSHEQHGLIAGSNNILDNFRA
jgi:hypothetical protein